MRALLLPLVLLSWLPAAGAAQPAAAAPTPGESDPEAVSLLRKVESRMRADTSESVYRVEVVRPDWRRTMRFRSHDDRTNDRFRMEIIEPAKSRGTVFMKVGRQLSMYLPKLNRSVAISPVMMHDPWMGTDFNNQDLLEAGALVDDYVHHVVKREMVDGVEHVTIESQPLSEAPVSWNRLVQVVTATGLPVSVEYRACEGGPVRVLRFEEVRELGGRQVPSRWVMTPVDTPGQRTEIVIEEIAFDVPIPAGLFQPSGASGAP